MARDVRAARSSSFVTLCSAALLATACGGGASYFEGPVGGGGGPPGTTVTVTIPPQGPGAPAWLLHGSGGTDIAYFLGGDGSLSQARLKTGDGLAFRVQYGAEGAIDKVVNERNGSYVLVRPREDAPGAVILSFDGNGNFLGGFTLFQGSGGWYGAQVLGVLGQITGSFTGALQGSFALRPVESVYAFGPAQPLGDKVSALLDHAASGVRPGPGASPWATISGGKLASAALISIAGGLLFTSGAGPVAVAAGVALLAVGVVQVGRALIPFVKDLSFLDLGTDGALQERAADQVGISNPIAGLADTVAKLVEKGRGALDAAAARVQRTVGSLPGVATPGEQADTTAPAKPLPGVMPKDATATLVGTAVDAFNRVYTLAGQLANGMLQVGGTDGGGNQLRLQGTVDGAGALSGGWTHTPAGGPPSSGPLVNAGTTSVGACQTTSQSGGNGTFAYAFSLGAASGRFALSYDMYSIPDAMTVVVGGKAVYTTGGLVSGGAALDVTFSGGDTAFVMVSAPNAGTAWTFTIGCARP